MSLLAFLYPGQGSQKVGMGADLLEAEPELFTQYLAQAEDAAGLPIRQYALEGPIEALTRTEVAQPALFCLSLALTDAARARGLSPDIVAGHSLGEYTAAVAAGAVAVEDGIRLVALRGKLMAEIQDESPGAMAAIIGLDPDQLRELCAQASTHGVVTLANLNSPTQIVISGESAAVDNAVELAEEAGASRVVKLQVGAAFHSEPDGAGAGADGRGDGRRRLARPARAARLERDRAGRAHGRRGPDGARRPRSRARCSGSTACRRSSARASTTFLEVGPGRVLARPRPPDRVRRRDLLGRLPQPRLEDRFARR